MKSSVVHSVVSVSVALLKTNPPTLRVSAIGNITADGYNSALLIPHDVGEQTPSDGVYDYTMVAIETDERMLHGSTGAVSATLEQRPAPEAVTGVRVHGHTNCVSALLDETSDGFARAPTLTPTYFGFIDDKGKVVLGEQHFQIVEADIKQSVFKLKFKREVTSAMILATARHRHEDAPCYPVMVARDFEDPRAVWFTVRQKSENNEDHIPLGFNFVIYL